jgi:hypothetical protein
MKLRNFIFRKTLFIKEDIKSVFEDEFHNQIRRTTKVDSLLTNVQFHRLGAFRN